MGQAPSRRGGGLLSRSLLCSMSSFRLDLVDSMASLRPGSVESEVGAILLLASLISVRSELR